MNLRDKCRGCLIGGAAGDALGYAIEFETEASIFRRFGPGGITEYALRGGKALISDDTQMTLFTANGLLNAIADGAPLADGIREAYTEWYKTMTLRAPEAFPEARCFLAKMPELYSSRAPGTTCMSAIAEGADGTVSAPINNSKGCGGVMRVAPIGLLGGDFTASDAARLAAEACAFTHGHELGWLSGAALAYIVHRLAHEEDCSIAEAVLDCTEALPGIFPDAIWTGKLTSLLLQALELADSEEDDLTAIHTLGEGWVGEEALAIAVFAAVRYSEDFESALIAAVNHKGDSDSTGAVCGNILGASLGLRQIPEKFLTDLELRDTLQLIADDLAGLPASARGARYTRP